MTPRRIVASVIVCLGDLVEDIVVRTAGEVCRGSDTAARVTRRLGGSAANVAVSVVQAGGEARFVGAIGNDAVGESLESALRNDGVDVQLQRAANARTGCIIVLVSPDGERSFLSDRGAAIHLDAPIAHYFKGATHLHVPLYSWQGEPLASTTWSAVARAHERCLTISVDCSSHAVMDDFGPLWLHTWLERVRPSVIFANETENERLSSTAVSLAMRVVKRGSSPVQVFMPGTSTAMTVAVPVLDNVGDTTGAGDAFAGGFLASWCNGADPRAATVEGIAASRRLLAGTRPTL